MKLPQIFTKKKYQAVTATRRAEPDCASEPNIKLSSAVVVVLVLHLVAIGGIYLFSSLKVHESADAKEAASAKKSDGARKQSSSESTLAIGKTYRVKSGDTLAKIAASNGVSASELEEMNDSKNVGALRVGQEIKVPAKPATKPVSAESRRIAEPKTQAQSIKDSGETYLIAKGDSIVSVAKKLRVSQDELLKLNRIEDPKKLQIGQKIRVPAKHKTEVAAAQ